jgi:hypothetical protein
MSNKSFCDVCDKEIQPGRESIGGLQTLEVKLLSGKPEVTKGVWDFCGNCVFKVKDFCSNLKSEIKTNELRAKK